MKKILGVNIGNFFIYLGGLLLSILLMGLYFIDPINPWCVVCCSIGASLIGAVVLGYLIELGNARSRQTQNKNNYELSNQRIYSEMNFLLMAVYNAISDIKFIKEEKLEYKNKTLSELVDIFVEEIKQIKFDIAPIIASNGENEKSDIEVYRKQRDIKEKIKFHEDLLVASRNEMFERKKEFINYKPLLIVNETASKDQIFAMQAALTTLGNPKLNPLTKENELIEMGNSLEELKRCDLIKCFEEIGMSKIRYSNEKGYFDLTTSKGK